MEPLRPLLVVEILGGDASFLYKVTPAKPGPADACGNIDIFSNSGIV